MTYALLTQEKSAVSFLGAEEACHYKGDGPEDEHECIAQKVEQREVAAKVAPDLSSTDSPKNPMSLRVLAISALLFDDEACVSHSVTPAAIPYVSLR